MKFPIISLSYHGMTPCKIYHCSHRCREGRLGDKTVLHNDDQWVFSQHRVKSVVTEAFVV